MDKRLIEKTGFKWDKRTLFTSLPDYDNGPDMFVTYN